MKIAFYSIHNFERDYITKANNSNHELLFLEERLTEKTVELAKGCLAICIFVADKTTPIILKKLFAIGIQFIVLRSAGYNHIDLVEAKRLDFSVARVPKYSPYSVAEHAVTLMLSLNRQIIHAHNRIAEMNFSLDGLVGFDMHGKTVGIIGTGKIGCQVAKILSGFGCTILAFDTTENESLKNDYKVTYVDLKAMCNQCDIISLHLPLTPKTKYIIGKKSISLMKKGVMIINTSRGALVNTVAVIEGIKSEKIGYFGMDVYEEEDGLFFEDHSQDILQDDVIARLMTFKNVLITSHQAFLTDTALKNIAETTIHNIDCFEKGILSGNELSN